MRFGKRPKFFGCIKVKYFGQCSGNDGRKMYEILPGNVLHFYTCNLKVSWTFFEKWRINFKGFFGLPAMQQHVHKGTKIRHFSKLKTSIL